MPSDLELAKRYLKEKKLCFVFFKDGILIAQSREKGIKDLYKTAWLYKEELKGASAADKVIGKAAATILIDIPVKECFGNIVSESAIDLFRKSGIRCSFDEKVKVILNSDQTGICPFEELVKDLNEPDEILEKIREKLDGRG